MKKVLILVILSVVLLMTACGSQSGYVLDEKTFFLVMTNVQYYPDQYLGKDFQFDAFVYDLEDVDGVVHRTVVRKCSAGYGCTCGKDTVIGFVIKYDGTLPDPRNQGEDSNDKTWLHCVGQVDSGTKQAVRIYAYSDGAIDYNTIETIEFPVFRLSEYTAIQDYSNLHYYVTK